MSTIGRIVSSIATAYVLTIIIGICLLQVSLFNDGLASLGIGIFGAIYFVGGALASIALLCLTPKSGRSLKLLTLYPAGFIIVGTIGFQGMLGGSSGSPSGGALADPMALINGMAALVALMALWLTPLLVNAVYGYQAYTASQHKAVG